MSEKRKELLQKIYFFGGLTFIAIVFLFALIDVKNSPIENPSYYDTDRIEDMNYDELEDYNDWLEKQKDKEYKDSKVYR